jgi:glycosyltransferase involved in cell wall biosynthesis
VEDQVLRHRGANTTPDRGGTRCLSVVVPALNEEDGIEGTVQELARTMRPLPYRFEIIVVDDGSRDRTFDRVAAMSDAGWPVRAIRLSRNFGKEAALLAGLQQARGDAVLTIDADLQHPPGLIPNMVAAWERGAKVVHAVKRRHGEHWWVRFRAHVIYVLITSVGGIDVRNSSDFKLLDRTVIDVLVQSVPERGRFYRGLVRWLGFPQATLEFEVGRRAQGESRWTFRSLLGLSLTALVSFTSAPLRIVTVLGGLTFALGAVIASDTLISWHRGRAVSGFATIIMTLLIVGSFIMISLGIIGEYIAKIYDEIKQRPVFVIDRTHGPPVPSATTGYDVGNDGGEVK